MAHHLAEVLQEAENAEGDDKELARGRAVDLILKIWSHKQSLPGGAYPLNDLEPVLSVLGKLSSQPPRHWLHRSDATKELLARIYNGLRYVVGGGTILVSKVKADATKELLARIYNGLRYVVGGGAILVSKVKAELSELDEFLPFLDDDERQMIEDVKSWVDYVQNGYWQSPLIVLTEEDQAEYESKQTEMAELEELDPKSRSNRIFSKEIDELIEALSELKLKIAAEDAKQNTED